MSSVRSSKPLPKGITTAALLKSQLDRGKDYFDLLTPFVLREVLGSSGDVLHPAAIRAGILRTCGLDIPLRTISSLLDRLAKRQESGIRKEDGAHLRAASTTIAPDTADRLTHEFLVLGRAFAQFCEPRLPSVQDEADALDLLSRFLEAHSATIVLDGAPPSSKTDRREDVVVATFVSDVLGSNGVHTQTLLSLLQGLVLARAVTLEDLSEVERKLAGLSVYFDTSFVLALAGLYGAADYDASKDTVRLVRELGALPAVFDVTIDETRRVLAVYEDLLDTAEGRERLFATPLTAYLLSQNARGTDVRAHSELLERTLTREGLVVHETPARVPEYVSDEVGLASALKDVRGSGYERREKHDLDAIAAILTLRRGRVPSRIEDAVAILAAVGKVVRSTQRWWTDSGARGMCPVIDQAALLNYCWLKRPSVATRTHRHELAALCAATLTPSEDAWSAFRDELRRFAADGRISSDEAALILVDSYSSKLLVEAEAAESISPISAAAIVDRVRQELRKEVAAAQAETLREREERASAVALAETQRVTELQAKSKEFSQQLQAVDHALQAERQQREALEGSLAGLARVLAWIASVPVAAVLVALVAAVVVFPFISTLSLSPGAQRLLQGLTVAVGIMGGAFGVTALSIGRSFHRWMERRIGMALVRNGRPQGDGAKPSLGDGAIKE